MTKNKITVLLISVIVIVQTISGQTTATISGRIIDGTSTEAIPFASIVLLNSDTVMTAGTLSELDGRFILEGISQGTYQLEYSYIGYRTERLPVLVGGKNPIYNLGDLNIVTQANELEEVVINAQRATVSSNLDKKSFSLTDQVAQSGGSILDAMKALPGIAVDQEGNVLLRGSDQVAVLIDGKQSGMTGFGSQRGLGNIPAANIERIEIINNPSAKYDASGMAGIINIIYKKEKETGFNGEIGMFLGLGELTTRKENLATSLGRYKLNPKYNPNLSLNYRTTKSNSYLQAEVLNQRKLPNNEFTTRSYNDGTKTISAVPENRKQTHYIVKTGTEWTLNENNTLGISGIWDYESHVDTSQVPFINLLTNQRNRYYHWNEVEVTGFVNVQADFEHKFADPGHQLTLQTQYSRGWEDESYFLNDSSAIRQGTDATHLIATEHTTTFNADYVKPLRSGRVELGTQLRFRTIPVTYDITPGEQSIIYEGIGDFSDWGENLYSFYSNYLLEKESVDIEAGLRLEYADVFYNVDPDNIYYAENDAYNYFRLFPNVRLTFKLDPVNNLSLFFNNRVDRPGEPNLRVFPKYDDPELLKVGNPYVRPQFTQTYEAAYKRIWDSGSLFLAVYYRNLESPFLRIYSIDDSNPDYTIINKIYQNVGSGSNTGLEVLLSQKVGNIWNLSAGFNWYNNTIDAFSGTLLFPFVRPFKIDASSDQTWDFKLNNQISIAAQTELQLTVIYQADKNTPQGRQLSRSSIDIGLKHTILNGKGAITFAFSDIFNGFGIREEIITEDFTALYENYYESQVVRLGMSYRL